MEIQPIPVTLLTGFLGSGKTRLLYHILKTHPLTAVVMNELGEGAWTISWWKHPGAHGPALRRLPVLPGAG